MDHYGFSYFAPRGWAVMQCARYLKKVYEQHPDGNPMLLPIITKQFYITENNKAYAVHNSSGQKTV